MAHWLTLLTKKAEGSGHPTQLKLAVKVSCIMMSKCLCGFIDQDGCPFLKVTEKLRPCGGCEVCAACGVDMPVTNLQQETCQNGHTWSECEYNGTGCLGTS